MPDQPIVLVTGANRGLGLEVCRQMAGRDYLVLLSARDLEKARVVAERLDQENVIPVRLDVRDPGDIEALYDFVQSTYGALDVLVNNAAIHYDSWQRAKNADLQIVQEAMDTNLYGPWRLCQIFLPLLLQSHHPRIVNVSSQAGALTGMGGGTPAYRVSKAGLNALTSMLAAELGRHGVLVNAVCPGWVATDMGGGGGRSVEEGARGIVWAATLPDDGPTGGFFRDGQPLEW